MGRCHATFGRCALLSLEHEGKDDAESDVAADGERSATDRSGELRAILRISERDRATVARVGPVRGGSEGTGSEHVRATDLTLVRSATKNSNLANPQSRQKSPVQHKGQPPVRQLAFRSGSVLWPGYGPGLRRRCRVPASNPFVDTVPSRLSWDVNLPAKCFVNVSP